jgi:hypothetical protein
MSALRRAGGATPATRWRSVLTPEIPMTTASAPMLASCQSAGADRPPQEATTERRPTMELGAFSISLAVKDLAASRAFYEKLGFTRLAGDPAQNWLILQNGTTTIGLFQGMFERNIMTFNPSWNQRAE